MLAWCPGKSMRFGHRFESRYYQKSTLSENLIVAWPLDEASGTRYPDYGGAEFNLTDVNTVGTADAPPGIGGLCASFNGSTEYLYCADPFPPPSQITIAVWIYPTATAGKVIIGQDRYGAGSDRSYVLYLNATSKVEIGVSSDGTALSTAASSAAASTNTWALATGIWDGASLLAYRNTSPGTPVAFAGPLWNSAAQAMIGANSNGGTPFNFFPGRIAQPLIWSRALTAAEISYLYNSGNGRPLTDWL